MLFPLTAEAEARRLGALNAVIADLDAAWATTPSMDELADALSAAAGTVELAQALDVDAGTAELAGALAGQGEPPRRRYRPKGSRPASAVKAQIASVRPRDGKGRFLPRQERA